MENTAREIGAFEAKTRLAELLRETEQGMSFVILRRGKPVARLVPVASGELESDWQQILEDMKKIRARVKGPVDVVELVKEGRRY
jgi:prevent-host-death family protein